jgi:hypothetical protein
MGMLTREERDGLEDVFMSIHSRKNVYNIIKHYNFSLKKSLKHAKIGYKIAKFYKFMQILNKKKKNLRK